MTTETVITSENFLKISFQLSEPQVLYYLLSFEMSNGSSPSLSWSQRPYLKEAVPLYKCNVWTIQEELHGLPEESFQHVPGSKYPEPMWSLNLQHLVRSDGYCITEVPHIQWVLISHREWQNWDTHKSFYPQDDIFIPSRVPPTACMVAMGITIPNDSHQSEFTILVIFLMFLVLHAAFFYQSYHWHLVSLSCRHYDAMAVPWASLNIDHRTML